MKKEFKFTSLLAIPLALVAITSCGNNKKPDPDPKPEPITTYNLDIVGNGFIVEGKEEKYSPNAEANISITPKTGYILPPVKEAINVMVGSEVTTDFVYEHKEDGSANFKITMANNVYVNINTDKDYEEVTIAELKEFITSRHYSTEERAPEAILATIYISQSNIDKAELTNEIKNRYGIDKLDDATMTDYLYEGSCRINGATSTREYITTKFPDDGYKLRKLNPLTVDDIDDIAEYVRTLSGHEAFFDKCDSGSFRYEGMFTSMDFCSFESTDDGYPLKIDYGETAKDEGGNIKYIYDIHFELSYGE